MPSLRWESLASNDCYLLPSDCKEKSYKRHLRSPSPLLCLTHRIKSTLIFGSGTLSLSTEAFLWRNSPISRHTQFRMPDDSVRGEEEEEKKRCFHRTFSWGQKNGGEVYWLLDIRFCYCFPASQSGRAARQITQAAASSCPMHN